MSEGMSYIPLNQAVFCCECNCISKRNGACPACGAVLNLVPLAVWLNRKMQETEQGETK